jgi:hypothetical protein
MKKVVFLVAFFVSVTLLVSACKKKEEAPVPKSPMQQVPMQPAPMQPTTMQPSPHGNAQKPEKKIVVPESVRRWNKVKLIFIDKSTNKTTEYIVKVGSELKIPNTNLKIMVGEFLPDFKMTETEITSSTDMPNNPAVRIEVFEDGKSIFKGWLYAKFPMIHPFEHQKYGLALKEGMKS